MRKFCTSACQIAIIVPATLESPPQPLGRDPIVQLQRAHTWESCAVLIFAAGRSVLIPSQLSRFSCALGPLCLVLLVVPRHYDDHTRDACKEVKCCVSQCDRRHMYDAGRSKRISAGPNIWYITQYPILQAAEPGLASQKNKCRPQAMLDTQTLYACTAYREMLGNPALSRRTCPRWMASLGTV